jgi:large subunit ribosomal protein L18
MDHHKATNRQRQRRRNRVRRHLSGTAERPRLSVHRSSKHIYAQLIDDTTGVTLAACGSAAREVRGSLPNGGNIKAAAVVGAKIAELAKAKGITKAAFDRGHYKYHGRIKALAEAATKGGLVCCTVSVPKEKPAEKPQEKQDKKEKKQQQPKEPKEARRKSRRSSESWPETIVVVNASPGRTGCRIAS